MGWKLVKAADIPLGGRIIRFGMKGNDVLELQKLLAASGFYFGSLDGIYGVLNEEAVSLFQKTFGLRNDGIAGPETLKTLTEVSLKLNRLIYSVKPKDTLKSISEKFGVAKSAWRGIPGQGNPERKIYPGMRLLLIRKAVLCSGETGEDFPATARLEVGWEISASGELLKQEQLNDAASYRILVAQAGAWEKVLTSTADWSKIAANLKRENPGRWGIDFRNAPLKKVCRWKKFLDQLCKTLHTTQIPLIIIPLLKDGKELFQRFYWLNLPQICGFAKLISAEPVLDMETPAGFLKEAAFLPEFLGKLSRAKLGHKILLMGAVGGWDWNLDREHQRRKVTYREGKLLAALNQRSTGYDSKSTYTVVNYSRRHENHCLIFRDQQGWRDWIGLGIKYNLLGFVIHDSKNLGKFGTELFGESFGLLDESRL
ncbi:MAG: hypothetical protein GX075_10130 [Firmicutes bacterium]|nr:hypothetical protein [Bacillota bacterium]